MAAYLLRLHVHRFLALGVGVVMGRFVPLPFIALFLGTTSTAEREEEKEADEEKQELLAWTAKLRLTMKRHLPAQIGKGDQRTMQPLQN